MKNLTKAEFKEWVNKKLEEFVKMGVNSPSGEKMDRTTFFAWIRGLENERISNLGVCSFRIGDYQVFIDGQKERTVIFNFKTLNYGVCRCSHGFYSYKQHKEYKGDIFDVKTGIAVAWTKYQKEKVPYVSSRIKVRSLRNGDVFKVNGFEFTYIGRSGNPNGRVVRDSSNR